MLIDVYEEFCKEEKLAPTGRDYKWTEPYITMESFLKTHQTICWNDVTEFMQKCNKKGNSWGRLFKRLVQFCIFLDKKGLVDEKDSGTFIKNESALKMFLYANYSNKRKYIVDKRFRPSSIIIYPEGFNYYHNSSTLILSISDDENELINKYLLNYIGNPYASRIGFGAEIMFQILSEHKLLFTDISKYSDSSFEKSCDVIMHEKITAYKKIDIKQILTSLQTFYIWIQTLLDAEHFARVFKKYTPTILKFPYLSERLLSGWIVVPYSVYNDVPDGDKLILSTNDIKDDAFIDKLAYIDVSALNNIHLKKWAKSCFWYDENHVMHSRVGQMIWIVRFAKIVEERVGKTNLPDITIDDVLTYKATLLESGVSSSQIASNCGPVKFFLNYLENQKVCDIPSVAYSILDGNEQSRTKYIEAYTNEEVRNLLKCYQDNYENCDNKDQFLYKLYYLAFKMFTITEMRMSTILNLRIDELHCTLSKTKQEEYKIVTHAKNSYRGQKEYNITKEVKKIWDAVKEQTDEVRTKAQGPVKRYLFIYERLVKKVVAPINEDSIAEYHNLICDTYGIRKLRLAAVRNAFMRNVSDVTDGDTLLTEKLSGHTFNVHVSNYDRPDIRDFCALFFGVEFGNINLQGKVTAAMQTDKSSYVLNGCGSCESDVCSCTGPIDCLLCSHFVTTPAAIPEFKTAIKELDYQIVNQSICHEKEFLVSKKKLYVAYLCKLLEKENENEID